MKTYKELMEELNEAKENQLANTVRIDPNTSSFRSGESFKGYTDADIVATIKQKHTKAGNYQYLFRIKNSRDNSEFKPGSGFTLVRISNPLTSHDGSASIARIDLKTGRISFVDDAHYTATDEVKWERFFKFTDLLVVQPKYFGIN